jgi:hypothetical protein
VPASTLHRFLTGLGARRTQGLVAILIVLGVAALLRVVHYDYDVGRALTYDTETKIAQARAVARGELEPRNWKQPYFLPYAGGFVLWVAQAFTKVDSRTAERLMTLLMVALAVGTVLVTYAVAERAANRKTGLVAAALIAVVPLHVVGSRYIKEDMPVVFFCTVALLFLARLVETGSYRAYALSGLAVGWAIGTKFSAILLLPLLALACVLRVIRSGVGPRGLVDGRVVVAGLLVLVGCLCFNPYVLADPEAFARGFTYQVVYSEGTHHDGTRIEPWSHLWGFYLRHALFPGLTWFAASAALLGVFQTLAAFRDPKRFGLLLVAAWTLLAYFVFEKATAKPFPFFARYVLPVVPSACILAAAALVELEPLLRARLRPRLATFAWHAIVVATLGWPLVKSALVSVAIADDTRLTAARWIDETVPNGSKLALDDPRYSPRPSESRFTAKYFGLFSNRLHDSPLERLRAQGYDYVVINSFRTERFRIARSGSEEARRADDYFADLRRRATLVREFRPRFALQTYGFHNPVIAIYDIRSPHQTPKSVQPN